MTVPGVRPTLAATLLCVVTACASLPEYEPPLRGVALAPDPTTRLGRHAAKFAVVHGPGFSARLPSMTRSWMVTSVVGSSKCIRLAEMKGK